MIITKLSQVIIFLSLSIALGMTIALAMLSSAAEPEFEPTHRAPRPGFPVNPGCSDGVCG